MRYSKDDSINYYTAKRVIDGFLDHAQYKNEILVENIASYQDGYLLKPKESNTREEAEAHCGYFLGIPFLEAKERFGGSSDPYLFEYLKLKVIDYESKQPIGEIHRIEEIQGKVLFIVKLSDRDIEIMLPAVSDYVVKTDTKKGVLYSQQFHELVQD